MAKGYMRLTAGPYRNEYLHRLLGAFKVGRPLNAGCMEVHHENGNKLDFGFDNIGMAASMDTVGSSEAAPLHQGTRHSSEK